jgi:hypothetical protein
VNLPELTVRVLILLVGLAVLAACSSDKAATAPTAAAASFTIVSGDHQSAMVASQLAKPVALRVTDAHGTPVEGFVVNFVVENPDDGSHVYGGAEQTDQDGVAQELWTLGDVTLQSPVPNTAPDSQILEARAVNGMTGAPEVLARFHATALPGPPDIVDYYVWPLRSDPQNGGYSGLDSTFGAHLTNPFKLIVLDRFTNPCTGDTVVFTVKPGSGTITGANAVVDATGGATLASWTLGQQSADTVIATMRGASTPYLPFVIIVGAHP